MQAATHFNKDFGMMPKLISDLNLSSVAQAGLLGKLSFIHSRLLEFAEEEAERKHG